MDKGTYKLLDSWRRETGRDNRCAQDQMLEDLGGAASAICEAQEEIAHRHDRWLNRMFIGFAVVLCASEFVCIYQEKVMERKMEEFKGEMRKMTEDNVVVTPDHGKHRYRINQVVKVFPAPPGGRFQTACTEYEVWPERSSKDIDGDDDKPVVTFTVPGTLNGCAPK